MLTGRKIDATYLHKVYNGEFELYTLFAHSDLDGKIKCINNREYNQLYYDDFKYELDLYNEDENITIQKYQKYLEDNKDTILDIDISIDDDLGYRIKFNNDEIQFNISSSYLGSCMFPPCIYDKEDCNDIVINLMKEFLNNFIK